MTTANGDLKEPITYYTICRLMEDAQRTQKIKTPKKA